MEPKTRHSQKVESIFDTWAENGRAEGMQEGHAVAAREALDALALGPSKRYLDIGCGNGYSVRWAAKIDASIQAYGLDLSAKMVERARRLSEGQENARFIHGPYPMRELKARF